MGRPKIGERVATRLDAVTLAKLDDLAAEVDADRSATVRALLETALEARPDPRNLADVNQDPLPL